MTEHPITPPHKLVEQWHGLLEGDCCPVEHATSAIELIATQAARWGADQELEACCEWLKEDGYHGTAIELRDTRRPNPPSLKEQALIVLDDISNRLDAAHENIIRRALESIPDDN